MATSGDMVARLRSYEPDYAAIERIGVRALPSLERIIETGDRLLASKAAYVATRIWGARTSEVLNAALARKEPEIRLSVAAGAQSVAQRDGKFATRKPMQKHQRALRKLLRKMIKDPDTGIRKVANRAVYAFQAVRHAKKSRVLATKTTDPAATKPTRKRSRRKIQ